MRSSINHLTANADSYAMGSGSSPIPNIRHRSGWRRNKFQLGKLCP